MVLSFLREVVSLLSLESMVLDSNRVCAVFAGFFHLLWMNKLKGPKGIFGRFVS